jgi:NAD(P)-dependent dehydrogenase (short-subunit alcohol dehydrogenase family)
VELAVSRCIFIQLELIKIAHTSSSRPTGIGLGIVRHLLDNGANGVVIADLNAVAGAKVIDELRETTSS